MCGITGFWSERLAGQHGLESIIDRMTNEMHHRGPDGSGTWTDSPLGLALGHRRLSILDLSEAGRQPMSSHSGRFVLNFNGEVFNFKELRSEFSANKSWRSNCDSEVIVEACERWGVHQAVSKLNGQFAIALWDTDEQKLWLIRDRVGIKPLYYYQANGQFAFASELRPFNHLPEFEDELDPEAVRSLIARGTVAAPLSVFTKVRKLEPGCILELESPSSNPGISRYWGFESTANDSVLKPLNDGDPVDALDKVLKASVKRRMIADVPLGAFLSGGIDSSLVVSLMQAQSEKPVKTFSIGFEEKPFDESPFARGVAEHLGTDHTELIVRSKDALDIVPNLAEYSDEPFADQSLIPTLMVSKLAREQVTVSLSGDGGDELFGGYSRYFRLLKRWPKYRRARLLFGRSVGNWWLNSRLMGRAKVGNLMGINRSDDLDRYFRYATALDLGTHYQRSIEANCLGIIAPDLLQSGCSTRPFASIANEFGDEQAVMRLMLIDSVTYLPDDILTKVDRASMHYSLEARVPLLDHEVIEFAFRLKDHHRVANGSGKLILKQLLGRYVPKPLFDRKKKGFGVPIADWLRTDLRDWAESLLEPSTLASSGFFDVDSVSRIWQQHLSGATRWYARLWRVLVFQNWYTSSRKKKLQSGLSENRK